MFRRGKKSLWKKERGVTLLVTVVSMIPLLGMAALAIDIVTLYTASGEAQKAADAGALAGAKAFVTSGFTSGQLGDPSSGGNQTFVCNGSTGFSDLQAQAAAQQNFIAGAPPTSITTSCNFTSPEDPSISVTVTKSGLPTFFARIWGTGASTATATGTAEAYNPSGSTTVPIQLQSVKPWLIPNCIPNTAPPCGPLLSHLINSSSNYTLPNPGPYIGQFYPFQQTRTAQVAGGFYTLDLTQGTINCPSALAAPAGSCSNVTSDAYQENIACSNTATLSCGDTVKVYASAASATKMDTTEGTRCLIHTIGKGNPTGSCSADTDPDCFVGGSPVTINGGSSNPNSSMQGATNISRSDSVVTVPVFDYQTALDNPCPTAACGHSVTVIGFLQLGIQSISLGGNGQIGAYILNASGCDPSSAGNPAVSGNGLSPVAVRLTQ